METGNRVRVLHVISGLGIGGAERLLLWAARHHDRERYPLGVISLMSGGELAREIGETGVPLVELGQQRGRLTPRGFFRLLTELRRFKPQILQGHMFHSNILVRFARPLSGVDCLVINTIHNEREPWHRVKIDAATTRLVGGFISFSPKAEEVFTTRRPGGRPVRHIPYGIEIPSEYGVDKESLRNRLGLPMERFIWITVGSLRKQKAHEDLIEAFSGMSKDGDNPILLVAGEGERRAVLERKIKEKGLGHDMRFLGLRRDVPDLMAASDAFVLSSHWEGNPLVLLEAMAASLPVVATRVGAVPTMVLDGETGLLVEPRRPDLLARAMERIMAMKKEAGKMGEEGRLRLERYYDFRRMQREVENFYDFLTGSTGVDEND